MDGKVERFMKKYAVSRQTAYRWVQKGVDPSKPGYMRFKGADGRTYTFAMKERIWRGKALKAALRAKYAMASFVRTAQAESVPQEELSQLADTLRVIEADAQFYADWAERTAHEIDGH